MFVTLRSIIRSIIYPQASSLRGGGGRREEKQGGREGREVKTMNFLICHSFAQYTGKFLEESVKYRYSGKYTVNSAL